MKYLLFLFLLLPAFLMGQGRGPEITTDTIFITVANGTYFMVQQTVYNNGEENLSKKRLGDSITAANSFLSQSIGAQQRYNIAAMEIVKRPDFVRVYKMLGDLYFAVTGQTIIVGSNNYYFSQFQGNYNIAQAGTTHSVELQQLPNGTCRFRRISDNATWTVRLLSDRSFELRNWSGVNYEMHSEDGILFRDINRVLRIKKQ